MDTFMCDEFCQKCEIHVSDLKILYLYRLRVHWSKLMQVSTLSTPLLCQLTHPVAFMKSTSVLISITQL